MSEQPKEQPQEQPQEEQKKEECPKKEECKKECPKFKGFHGFGPRCHAKRPMGFPPMFKPPCHPHKHKERKCECGEIIPKRKEGEPKIKSCPKCGKELPRKHHGFGMRCHKMKKFMKFMFMMKMLKGQKCFKPQQRGIEVHHYIHFGPPSPQVPGFHHGFPGMMRRPMGPCFGRPPMGPCFWRPPMGLCFGRPTMGPRFGRPMGPRFGRPPMGPCFGRPPMGPCFGKPPKCNKSEKKPCEKKPCDKTPCEEKKEQ